MQQITKNQLKYINRIKNNASFRKKENKVFIQGTHNIQEIVANKPNILDTVLKNDTSDNLPFLQNVQSKTFSLNKIQAKKLSFNKKPFSVAALVDISDYSNQSNTDYTSGIWVGLVNIQDPFNLGTIFRTAEAFGISGVLLFDNCVNPFNQKVVISSTGSVFRVPFNVIESAVEFIHKNKAVDIYGTAVPQPTGTPHSQHSEDTNVVRLENYQDTLFKSGIILFGNEGTGLDNKILQLTKQNLYIPTKSESLNLSVSVGIVLSNLQQK